MDPIKRWNYKYERAKSDAHGWNSADEIQNPCTFPINYQLAFS